MATLATLAAPVCRMTAREAGKDQPDLPGPGCGSAAGPTNENINADEGSQGRSKGGRLGLHEFGNPRPEQIPDLRRSRIYHQP